jgi:hypothetical protein
MNYKMKRIQNRLIIVIIFILAATLHQATFARFPALDEQVIYYSERYKVNCTDEKITDNFGNGFPELYGTRNMRPILHGVAYRGGANNYYHKSDKRDNQNPLPPDGMLHLCMEGFTDAVYLYSKNFVNSDKQMSVDGKSMNYHQISGNTRDEIKQIISMVYDVINRNTKGPLYFHCWNGWHQSGYVSSAILKQFCDYDDDDAFDYWMRNTDGVNKGYDKVKAMVRDFRPFPEYKINPEIKKLICPCRGI